MLISRSFTWKIHKSLGKVCLNLFLNIQCSHPSEQLLVSCFSQPTLCILIAIISFTNFPPLLLCINSPPPIFCSYQLFDFVLLSRLCVPLYHTTPCVLQVILNSAKEYGQDFCAILYKLRSMSGNCSNCSSRTLKFKVGHLSGTFSVK